MTSDPALSLPLDDAPHVAAPPHAPLSLRWNSFWMLLGNGVYAGCQWAMLTVLAKFGTPETVGQFVLALAVTSPVMALFLLQLRAVQATDARSEFPFGHYLAVRLAMAALALAAIAGIALASDYRRETVWVILAMGVSAAVDSASDIIYGLLQQHERMDRVAQSMLLKGPLALAALGAMVLGGVPLFGAVLGIAAARLAVLLLCDLRNAAAVLRDRAAVRPCWDLGRMASLVRLAWPMGLVMMLIVLSGNVPRYFVEHYVGERGLGIFGALSYLGAVGTTMVSAIGQSATPRLAQCYAAGRTRAFCTLQLRLVALGGAIGVAAVAVAMAAGQEVLEILYGPEYAEQKTVLVWAMVAAGIGYVAAFASYGVTAARYFRIQLPLFVVVGATAAGACSWLVPRHGLLGAAMAVSLAALAQLLGNALVVVHAAYAQVRSRAGGPSTHGR